MAINELKSTPKISVKIWRPIILKFDEKMEDSCLRRDAYLRRVLEVELDHLDNEVPIPNSKASYDYVFEQLDAFDRKLVSLALPHALTQRLNDICARKRIVRDAFFNRVFLLLAASPKTVDSLLFRYAAVDWREEVWSEWKHEGPFFQNGFYPLEPMIDPFWAMRSGLEILNRDDVLEDYVVPETGETVRIKREPIADQIELQQTIYGTVFAGNAKGAGSMVGMSCYLPDWRISGHPAEQAHQAKLDELMAGMELLP